jgi:hypothetical protein
MAVAFGVLDAHPKSGTGCTKKAASPLSISHESRSRDEKGDHSGPKSSSNPNVSIGSQSSSLVLITYVMLAALDSGIKEGETAFPRVAPLFIRSLLCASSRCSSMQFLQ